MKRKIQGSALKNKVADENLPLCTRFFSSATLFSGQNNKYDIYYLIGLVQV
jgi:hypothetical protein